MQSQALDYDDDADIPPEPMFSSHDIRQVENGYNVMRDVIRTRMKDDG